MELKEIGKFDSWVSTYARANQLLEQDQLTALALVSEEEYASGAYVATHLEEFAHAFGSAAAVLENSRKLAPMLYPQAMEFRLLHGKLSHSRPDAVVDGWLLVIVYSG